MLGLFLSTEGLKKSRMVRRCDLFGANGEGTYWFPRILSAEPNLVKFHDNVRVASDVYFCIHNVVKRMINAVSEYYAMLSESVRKLGAQGLLQLLHWCQGYHHVWHEGWPQCLRRRGKRCHI